MYCGSTYRSKKLHISKRFKINLFEIKITTPTVLIKFVSEIGLKVLYDLVYRPFPINVLFTCLMYNKCSFLQNFSSSFQTTNRILAKFAPNNIFCVNVHAWVLFGKVLKTNLYFFAKKTKISCNFFTNEQLKRFW